MKNPNPGDGGTDTLLVESALPNAAFTMTAHYKTKDSSYTGGTNSGGHGELTFGLGRPTVGYTVVVDVAFSGGRAQCQTSFTPQ